MVNALKRRDYLNLLSKSRKKKRRNALIDLGDREEINAVSECILNLLKNNIKIPKSKLRSIKKHKHTMRDVVDKNLSVSKRKKILKQKGGGFLPVVLPLALSALSKLLPQLLS